MNVDLLISTVSDNRKMNHCPDAMEVRCGILYRGL